MPDARPVTVMTLGVRYDELAPLCGGPRGVGDWATTPTDRPTDRDRASGDQSGRRLRFAGRIPNFQSAFCRAGAVCCVQHDACMDDRGGRRAR